MSSDSNSLWAALVAIFLVRFGSNFSCRLWQQYFWWASAAILSGQLFAAIFLVRFGSDFSCRLWQQYFCELRQQFSLGSSRSNIFGKIWQQFLLSAIQQYFGEIRQQFSLGSFSEQYFGETRQQFLFLISSCSNILVRFGSDSLWAALVAIFLVRFGSNFSGRLWHKYFGEIRQQFSLSSSRSNFWLILDSNFYFWLALAAIFLVRFGSNSLWAALAAIFLVRFGSNFSGHIWQQYFGKIRHQFFLGSCGNNIWCDNNLPDVEIIYLVW